MDRIDNQFDSFTYPNQNGAINFNNVVATRPLIYKSVPAQTPPCNGMFNNLILNQLNAGFLKKIVSSAKTVHLSCGEIIYRPDEPIHFIYFPETAVFSEYKIVEDGRIMELVMTGKEGVTGISSILKNQRAENFTQILQGGIALQISCEKLSAMFNDDAETKDLFFDYFNRFVNQISQRAVCSNFHLIENRLGCWLLMLQDRAGSDKLHLTHEQIAFSLGTHRPSITQAANKLREAELIDYKRGVISILNRGKLETFACSCYAPLN